MQAKPTVRQAMVSDAQGIHAIENAIPWLSPNAKSPQGFERVKSACERGEVWVVEDEQKIVSIMTLTKDFAAASCGYNIWLVGLIATAEAARRKGYARLLLHKAKEVIGDGALTAYIQNEVSMSLACSEGFMPVEAQADVNGYPLYEWTRQSQ